CDAAAKAAQGASSLADVSYGKRARALRFDILTLLKLVDYDYQGVLYNTEVWGAVRVLDAL
ncbi:MAG: hypothetical protein P3W95_007455, partial [Tepidimonas taiwanensis]|nr:hypothetical protein [Tepidimonas taiwanensis]